MGTRTNSPMATPPPPPPPCAPARASRSWSRGGGGTDPREARARRPRIPTGRGEEIGSEDYSSGVFWGWRWSSTRALMRSWGFVQWRRPAASTRNSSLLSLPPAPCRPGAGQSTILHMSPRTRLDLGRWGFTLRRPLRVISCLLTCQRIRLSSFNYKNLDITGPLTIKTGTDEVPRCFR